MKKECFVSKHFLNVPELTELDLKFVKERKACVRDVRDTCNGCPRGNIIFHNVLRNLHGYGTTELHSIYITGESPLSSLTDKELIQPPNIPNPEIKPNKPINEEYVWGSWNSFFTPSKEHPVPFFISIGMGIKR